VLGLFVAALCIAINGFFVAAEFALVKVRATSVRAKAKAGDAKAIVAQEILERIERYLSVSQLGITVASLGLGWVGEPAIAKLMHGLAANALGREPSKGVEVAIHVTALTALTFGHVIFGELVPKLVAIQRSERTALYAAIPLRVVFVAFRPVLWVLEVTSRATLVALGLDPRATEGKLSEEEIVAILATNVAHSPHGIEKSRLVERVLRFTRRTARHCMVPRVDVISIPIDTNGERVLALIRQHEYSRILLTTGASLDDIEGYLYAKDILLLENAVALANMRSLCRRIIFVTETRSAIDVLREMQRTNLHIAVLVDDYGGTSGIVTLEDLLEEIVGEIRDETDEEPPFITAVAGMPNVWEVDAAVLLEEIRALGAPIADAEIAEPLGTLVVRRVGRLPRLGDHIELAPGWRAEVTQVSRRRVTRVQVQRVQLNENVRPPSPDVPA
jgi:CBS domain containing-hemolysin-like protein